MKTKLLLIYGYLLPYVGSIIVASLPLVLPFISYSDISAYFQGNLGLFLGALAGVGAVSLPFQSKILHEDDPHVLAVLKKGSVRKVFVKASFVQATTIVLIILLLVIVSSSKTNPELIGFIELTASSVLVFESISLISNGMAYGKIREKIIEATAKALR